MTTEATSPATDTAAPARARAAGAPRAASSLPATEQADQRSVAQIEADMAATRERLARTMDDLQDSVSPHALRQRAVDRVRGFYLDEFGGIRPARVAVTAAVLVGWLLLRSRDRD